MFSPHDGGRGRFGSAARRALVVSALAAGLPGCSSDTTALRTLATEAGYGPPKPLPAPDFVAQTRRQGDYLPVGVSAPPRPVRAKPVDKQKALEAELESARGRNESRGRAAESAGRAVKPANP